MNYDIEFRDDGNYIVSRDTDSPSYCEWLMPGTQEDED
jgi:hypothetical protein